MSSHDPVIDPTHQDDSSQEQVLDRSLRPLRLDDFIGQPKVREQLEIFIAAAKGRAEALDHVLVFGPPGLGKTTLAHILAHEMGANLRQTSGPVLEKAGDLAAILTNLEPHDVLFVDEIHRLSPAVEEILYPALEDYQLDIIIGDGPAARSIKLNLPPFTLVGRHDSCWPADCSVARPFWHCPAFGVLSALGAGNDCRALGPHPRCSQRCQWC